jgi:hypothetical protein
MKYITQEPNLIVSTSLLLYYKQAKSALVLVPGRPFQPSLTFTSKAEAYPRVDKHYTILESPALYKHSIFPV